jgi:hypothetical protein
MYYAMGVKMKRRNKIIIVVGILMVLMGGILVYWKIPYSPYKTAFTKQIESRVNKTNEKSEVCTAEEIVRLPESLQKYCKYIKLENLPKYQVAHTVFKNTKFVFDAQSGKTLDMNYDLWLFYDEPYRSAYCTSSMYGIPFDGIDYCTEDKQGGMKGILGKTIQIFNVYDSQGYKAGLISWLAESVAVNPSALLSPYVTYETIDDLHVKATVTYNGISGSGIFTMNDEGEITEFYSDERQVEDIDGVLTPIGWRCKYEDYSIKNGMRQINTIRCIKVFSDKEVVYFDSDDCTVIYLK